MEGVVKVVPVASETPPVALAYQLIVPAEVVAPKAIVPDPHLEAGIVPVIVGIVFTVAITAVLVAVVQLPFVAATQYVVVEEILGVVKLVPVPSDNPPLEFAYQLIVPAEAVAAKATVPEPHLELVVVPVIVGIALIVIFVPLSVPVTAGLLLTTRMR